MKKSARININVGEGLDIQTALHRVLAVVNEGRISDEGKCFCYLSGFGDRTYVAAKANKPGSDSFWVYKEE